MTRSPKVIAEAVQPHPSGGTQSHEPSHLPALDGVRGVAIALVVISHSAAILRDVGIAPYIGVGWIGVDLFFVLSGFLITRILLNTRTDNSYYRRFYIRRGLRIWPLYYVYIFASLLLIHVLQRVYLHSPGNFGAAGAPSLVTPLWMYLLFFQNLCRASLFSSRDAMAITWSLCIEEHFYLVWPVCVRTFAVRALKFGLLTLLVLSPLLRLAAMVALRNAPYSTWLQTINRLTPFHLDAIGAGCLLCLLWPRLSAMRYRVRVFAALFLAGMLMTVVCLRFQEHQSVFSFCYSSLAVMFTGLVGLALNGWFAGILTHPFLRYLGKISYGLYLIHPTVFLFLQSHHLQAKLGVGNHVRLGEWAATALAITLSLLIASLSWKFYESRMLMLKSRLAP